MIQFQECNVHYTKKSGKKGIYNCKYALCIDGAEEACLLDIKGVKTIDLVEKVVS